jgi:hypothetical protein
MHDLFVKGIQNFKESSHVIHIYFFFSCVAKLFKID